MSWLFVDLVCVSFTTQVCCALIGILVGSKFEERVAEAEGLSDDTVNLDKTAGAIRKDLDAGFMSAPLKVTLRGRLEAVQKRAMAAKKAALAGRLDAVLADVKSAVESARDSKSLVLNVDIGAESKSAQKVMNTVKSMAPDLAFVGISEEEAGSGGKVMAFAIVPDALVEQGLKADDWIRSTLAVCGGRGGGRPGSAQGQAKTCNDVEAVMAAANEFAETAVGAATV